MRLSAVRLVVPPGSPRELVLVVERGGVQLARLLVQRPAGPDASSFDYLLPGDAARGPAEPEGVEVEGWLRTGLGVRVVGEADAARSARGITLFVQVVRRRFDPTGVMDWVEYLRWHCLGSLGREVPVSSQAPPAPYQPDVLPTLTAVG